VWIIRLRRSGSGDKTKLNRVPAEDDRDRRGHLCAARTNIGTAKCETQSLSSNFTVSRILLTPSSLLEYLITLNMLGTPSAMSVT
jgi:hypothetical protein